MKSKTEMVCGSKRKGRRVYLIVIYTIITKLDQKSMSLTATMAPINQLGLKWNMNFQQTRTETDNNVIWWFSKIKNKTGKAIALTEQQNNSPDQPKSGTNVKNVRMFKTHKNSEQKILQVATEKLTTLDLGKVNFEGLQVLAHGEVYPKNITAL